MSYRDDDDYRDDDENPDEEDDYEEEDGDEEDDDEQLGRRSSTSPFSTLRPGDTGRSSYSSGSTYGSSSRLPGSPGSSSSGSSGSTPRPYSGSSGSSGSSSGSSRPPYTPGGSSGSSGSSSGGTRPFSSGSSGSSSGSSGSSSGGTRPPYSPGGSSGSSGSSSGGTRPPYTPGGSSGSSGSSSSSSSSGSSSGGTRPFSSGSSYSPSSSGSSGSSGSSSGSSRPPYTPGGSSSSSSSSKPASGDKKDDKPASGNPLSSVTKGLGGLTSRLGGGGDKKDGKPASSGGNPLSNVTKGLGGLTSRLGGGDKGDKPATPKSGSSSGGALSGVTSRLGDLRSRLPGGGEKKDNKPAAKPSSSYSPSSSSSSASSSSGVRPPAFGKATPSGGASATTKTATGTTKAVQPQSIGDRLRSSLPFGRRDTTTTTKKTTVREKAERASKAPKVDKAGVSLDTKLDILGVALLLGSLALFFSSMSMTKGQVTEAVNTFLSQLLGWGAIAVPAVMFAIGMWLVVRHFGDEAPVVNPTRIVGLGVVYIALLIIFQYIDSVRSYYTMTLLDDFLQVSIADGRGGGWLGAELYRFLVLNITELGGVFVVAGTLVIGLMLLLRISAAEIAIFAISIGRSFADARRRRVQDRQAAARLAAQAAAASAAASAVVEVPQISVTKPAVAELPAAKPALPTPATVAAESLPEPRPIPITMGGKTVTAFFDTPESVPVETKPAASPAAQLPSAVPAPPAAKTGFGSRLFNAVPGRKTDDTKKPEPANPAVKPESEKSGGLLGGRLFNRSSEKPAASPPPAPAQPIGVNPATQTPAASDNRFAPPTTQPASTPPAASVAPARQEPPPMTNRPTASPFKADDAPLPKPEDAPMRLGDLMKPASSSSTVMPQSPLPERTSTPSSPVRDQVRPYSSPTPIMPAIDEDDEEDESLADMTPAKPKGTGPLPRPDNPFFKSPAAPAASPAPDPAAAREERLNALRAGQLSPSSPPPVKPADDKPDESPFKTDAPKPEDAPLTPAASVTATPAAEKSPFATTPTPEKPPTAPLTPTPFTPAASASTPPRQSAYPSDEVRPRPQINFTAAQNGDTAQPAASPAFRRPETPPGVPPTPQQPTIVTSKPRKVWKLPNAQTLLNAGSESDFDRETLLERARIIEETLNSFGAPGRVVEVNTGPVITQFGVEPDYLVARSGKKSRVKVGAIAQLDKDLQLALGAKSIRIEAPVPGKGYVGIEVPNDEAATVSLRDVMESDEFKKIRNKSPLAIALGQSVDGTPVAADLSSMPHLLVAGTTGSGKSVLVNSIICGLIVSNTPDKVKFVMVDPKRVELTGYNGIPHLLAPVVVELERIVGVLKWVTREMDERYKKFSNAGARNIEDFNKHRTPDVEEMPYIVVIIDELADLMMLAPDETERVITRIAALARATGIHLVIATQRPSVDVVTGLIKANFPARIAFAVAGGVDSRVILDQPGAERLLGRGDMLYLSGDSPSAVRLQGVFVSDNEINNITRYWKTQAPEEEATKPISALVLDDSIKEEPRSVMPRQPAATPVAQAAFWDENKDDGDVDDDDDEVVDGQDELYDQAVELVRRLNKASVSLLQRRLRIGYTRAARLIDLMEEQGIVGPAQEGSKPREVLTSPLKD